MLVTVTASQLEHQTFHSLPQTPEFERSKQYLIMLIKTAQQKEHSSPMSKQQLKRWHEPDFFFFFTQITTGAGRRPAAYKNKSIPFLCPWEHSSFYSVCQSSDFEISVSMESYQSIIKNIKNPCKIVLYIFLFSRMNPSIPQVIKFHLSMKKSYVFDVTLKKRKKERKPWCCLGKVGEATHSILKPFQNWVYLPSETYLSITHWSLI